MALVKGQIPNFTSGISQQAPALRLPTQSADEVNSYPLIVAGSVKRPPTDHVAVLPGLLPATAFSHFIQRDLDEEYCVTLSSGSLQVVNLLTGAVETLHTPSGTAYLTNTSGNPDHDTYAAATIADYTFIVNKGVTTAMASTTTATRNPFALLNIKAGNYGKTYSIKINGTERAYYATPPGNDATQAPYIDTVFIAKVLYSLLTGLEDPEGLMVNGVASVWYGAGTLGAPVPNPSNDIYNPVGTEGTGLSIGSVGSGTGTVKGTCDITTANGWKVERHGNAIYIESLTGVDFSIVVEDGFNGNATSVARKTIQQFTDLPSFAPDGLVVGVTGDTGNAATTYYVAFTPQNTGDGSGVWTECPAPGVQTTFDATTMPHTLVRNADGSFTFDAASWNVMDCGDGVNTNPKPSFIGNAIWDVLLHQSRLGFFSQDNVIMSRSGDLFNFWRTTATQLQDDDPIDVNAATPEVSILRAATAYQESLIVWSDLNQIALTAQNLLTPTTVSMVPITPYQTLARTIKPLAIPRRLFFAIDRSDFVGIREWYYDIFYHIGEADDDTAHVPTLIPAGAYRMVNTTIDDALVLASSGDRSSLWVYKYYWEQQQKTQSSWVRWNFPGATILDIAFMNSTLYLLMNRNGQTVLESMIVSPGVTDSGAPVTYLDRRVSGLSGTYSIASDTTAYTLPFTADASTVAVNKAGNASPQYYAPPVVSVSGSTVTLKGDTTALSLWFGIPYTYSYTLSPLYVRDPEKQAMQEGRLQVLKVDFAYANSGYFRVEVTPPGRAVSTYEMDAWQIGDNLADLDSLNLMTGILTVPVLSQSDFVKIQIINDSFLPSQIMRAEWKGNFVPKTRK